jgi:hypothetical protein
MKKSSMDKKAPFNSSKKFEYSITYSAWDEESLEMGETDDKGYEVEPEVENISEILFTSWSKYGIYYPVSIGTWESTDYPEDSDFYEKGIRKYYVLHLRNEDGTEISEEDNDFITHLLSNGQYNREYFEEYAFGGLLGDKRWNRSWHFDHDRYNKSESYEIPMSRRKKARGGDVQAERDWLDNRISNLKNLLSVINDEDAPELQSQISRLEKERDALGSYADGGNVEKNNKRNETIENNFGVSYKLGDKFTLGKRFGKKDEEVSIVEIMPSGLYFKVDKSDKLFSIKTLHSRGSNLTSGEYLVPIKKTFADGGGVEGHKHVLHIDGQNWFLEKIDSTHFYMSNDPNYRGMAHHIGQHKGEPYYEEVREWLKTTYAKGGGVEWNYWKIEKNDETIYERTNVASPNIPNAKKISKEEYDANVNKKFADGGETGELKNVRGEAFYITESSAKDSGSDYNSLANTFFDSKYEFESYLGSAIKVFMFDINVEYEWNIVKAIYKQMETLGLMENGEKIQIIGFELYRYPQTKFESRFPYKMEDEYEDEDEDEDKDDDYKKGGEILKKTIVYDNNGDTFDRYTVFTPDGSVYGMSDNPTSPQGFNQYLGDDTEVEKGEHLGRKLKSVPKSIEKAVLDRMEDDYKLGGGIYSSDDLYILKVYDLDGKLLDDSKRVWGRNISKAKEEAIDMYEYPMQQKYGTDLRFTVELAPQMMKRGGEAEDFSQYEFMVGDKLDLGSKGIKYFKEYDGEKIIVVDSKSDLKTSKGSYIYPSSIKKVLNKSYDEGGEADEMEDWMNDAIRDLRAYTDNDDLKIENAYDDDYFVASDGSHEYLVFEDFDEAHEYAVDDVKRNLEENAEYFQRDWLMAHLDAGNFFRDVFDEWNMSYATDIMTEDDNMYSNRLIGEMVEWGIMDSDEAESSDAEEIANDRISDFVNALTEDQINQGNNGFDYYIDNFGEEEAFNIALKNNLIDIDSASEDAVNIDGVAHFISSYDGEEIALENGSYAYRTN